MTNLLSSHFEAQMIPVHGSQDIVFISDLFRKLISELCVRYYDLGVVCETLPLADTDLEDWKSIWKPFMAWKSNYIWWQQKIFSIQVLANNWGNRVLRFWQLGLAWLPSIRTGSWSVMFYCKSVEMTKLYQILPKYEVTTGFINLLSTSVCRILIYLL